MNVKSNYTIRELEVFSIGITLYIKIEAENKNAPCRTNIWATILTDGQNGLY